MIEEFDRHGFELVLLTGNMRPEGQLFYSMRRTILEFEKAKNGPGVRKQPSSGKWYGTIRFTDITRLKGKNIFPSTRIKPRLSA